MQQTCCGYPLVGPDRQHLPCGLSPACVSSPEVCSCARQAHNSRVPFHIETRPLHQLPPAADEQTASPRLGELRDKGHGQRRWVSPWKCSLPCAPDSECSLLAFSLAESEEASVDDPSSGGLSVRERRRPRERRRGTGINFWTKDVSDGLCGYLSWDLAALLC